MKIIDFHTHIYPEKIAEKATASTCQFYGLETELTGTADELLRKGKKAGISEYVLLPVATKPEQVHSINQFTISQITAHNEFHGFGTLHAGMENPESEIEFIISSGLKGIKLHPDTQQFPTDDKRLLPVYDILRGRLPVLIHCGDKRYDYSHPGRLRKIIDQFPDLQVIAAHLGGWSMFDTAVEYLKDTNCYFDISSCLSFLPPEKIEHYISVYGSERVLFGTDFPLWDPEQEVRLFSNVNLKITDRENISYKNAERILYGQ